MDEKSFIYRKLEWVMTKILVINVHSYHNAGDAALAETVLRLLRDNFPQADITLAMDDPSSYSGSEATIKSFMAWFKHDNQGRIGWRWLTILFVGLTSLLAVVAKRLFGRPISLQAVKGHQETIRAYLDADLVVSCAGNYLYSSGIVGLAFVFSIYTMVYACMVGKPLYAMPQSIGPLKRWWEKVLVRWLIAKMRLVFIREPISWATLQTIGARGNNCHLVPDIAFAFPAVSYSLAAELLSEVGLVFPTPPLLGITVIDWQGQTRAFNEQERYEEAIVEAIRFFVKHYQGKVVLFSQVCGPTFKDDDRIPARRVFDRLKDLGGDRVLLLDRDLPPALLKSAYGLMDAFIGTRLHSNVFALSAGVPVIAIAYQYKTRGVMEMLGLGKWVLSIDNVDIDTLIPLLESAFAEHQQTRQQIAEMMPGVIESIGRVGQMMATDFYGL